jgi:hypothetical protein
VKFEAGLSGTMLTGPMSVSTLTPSHGTVRLGYLVAVVVVRVSQKLIDQRSEPMIVHLVHNHVGVRIQR